MRKTKRNQWESEGRLSGGVSAWSCCEIEGKGKYDQWAMHNEMVIKVSDERRHDQVKEGRGAQTPSG